MAYDSPSGCLRRLKNTSGEKRYHDQGEKSMGKDGYKVLDRHDTKSYRGSREGLTREVYDWETPGEDGYYSDDGY